MDRGCPKAAAESALPMLHRSAGALFRRWYGAYVDVLARTHLRAARPALAQESVTPMAPGKPCWPLEGVEPAGQ